MALCERSYRDIAVEIGMADAQYLFSEESLFGIKKGETYEIPRKEKKERKVKKDVVAQKKVDPNYFPCNDCEIKGKPVLSCPSTVKNPIMFIGLYPGYQEAKAGISFVGDSGSYLHKVLYGVGFKDGEFYLANIMKCRPLDSDGKQRPVTEKELKACAWFTEKEIEEVQPSLIVLMGELPVRYFLNRKFLSSVRGQIKIRHGQKFLITYNPAHIIREDTDTVDKKAFESDIQSAYDVYKGISRIKDKDYRLVSSLEELDEVLAFVQQKEAASIDFETYAPGKWEEKKALDPYAAGFKVLSLAITVEEDKGYCIPIEHPDSKMDAVKVKEKLKSFLESPIPKLGTNVKFDYKVAAIHFNIFMENIVFDAMLASSLLDSRKGIHNLDRLAMDWLGERSYKYEMYKIGTYIPLLDKLVERNCTDSDYVFRLYPLMVQKLKEGDLYNYFMEQRITAISALGLAEVKGLPVDKPYTENLAKEYEHEIEGLKGRIYKIPQVEAVQNFNIDSNKDIQTVLFEKFNFKPLRKIKTGFSTDKETISYLFKKNPDNEFLDLLQDYKDLEKFYGTYVDPLIKIHTKWDGRVHPTFTMHITSTGRLSCVDPNVQNVPVRDKRAKEIMDCYCASPGFRIGLADYSQMELRILAQISQDPEMLEAYRLNKDLHQKTADELSKVAGRKLSRGAGKGINFGIVYCLTGGTKIITKDGYKKIEDVQIGDVVLTHKGNWKRVMATQKFLSNEIYEIKTNTGKKISCTPDHMWLSSFPRSGNKLPNDFSPKRGFVRADELEVSKKYPHYLTFHNTPLEFENAKVFSVEEALILGWSISEGSYEKDKRANYAQYFIGQSLDANPDVFERMKSVLKMNYSSGVFYCNINKLINIFEKFGWDFTKKSGEKELPVDFLKYSLEVRKYITAGLWDGDGYVTKNPQGGSNIGYVSKSFNLLEGIKELLFSLGINCKVYWYGEVNELKIIGSLSKKRFLSDIQTVKSCREKFVVKRDILCEEKVISVNKFLHKQPVEVFDITVEDDHSFSANGLFTHNCMTEYGLSAELGCELKEAKEYIKGYLNFYEGVKEYQEKQKAFLRQHGYVQTLFGRKRWIKLTGDDKIDEEAYRKAVNTPIQGTASDINTMAFVTLIKLYRQEGFKSFPISVIHDAIMFELSEDELYLKDLNLTIMENLPLPFLTDVSLKVDWNEGKTWGAAKEK